MPGRMITVLVAAFAVVAFPLTAVLSGTRGDVRDKVKDDTVRFLERIREDGVISLEGVSRFREKTASYLDDLKLDISVGRRHDFVSGRTTARGSASGGFASGGFRMMAAHTHSDACFVGHNHAANGCVLAGGIYDCGIENEDSEPVCDRVITAIEGRDQVVFAGEGSGLDTRVKATFLDGHEEEILAEASGFDGERPGTYRVKLRAEGLIGTAKTSGYAETEIEVLVIQRTKTCPKGHDYEVNERGIDEGCPVCRTTLSRIYPANEYTEVEYGSESFECVIYGEYMDGNVRVLDPAEYDCDFDGTKCGLQTVEIRLADESLIEIKTQVGVYVIRRFQCETCGRTYEAGPDGEDGGCPFCSGEITQIRVVPVEAELEKGEELEVFVYAVYGDREERIYEEWTSDFDPQKEGVQNVTVMCLDMSYEICVTVKSEEAPVVCPVCGTSYDEAFDHCPSCRKTVTSVSVKEKDKEILYLGDVPKFEIEVTYLDGTKSKAFDGYYLDNYDPQMTGRQNVIVSYEGFSEVVTVMVWSGLPGYRDCGEGHLYLPLYDGEPCPYCNRNTGSDSSFEIVYSTDEIMEAVRKDGFFELSEGDAVTVSIVWGERMGRFALFGGGKQKASYCGGFIYDERWGDGD